jgi:Bacteriophage Mu Gp45 spike protein
MHRATPNSTSLRAYNSGGTRGVVDTIDDNKLMQEHSGTQMANESRGAIESPQNYGFTSVNLPADKDGQGNITGGPETFYSYMGGGRSFPIPGPIDDRRHRLRGLSPGDSAMHRGKDDDMQIHLAGDGMYHSAPQMVRLQLVPQGSGAANPPQTKSQAPQAKQSLYATFEPRIQARLWAGLEPELERELDLELERRDRAANSGLSVEARAGNGGGGGGGSGGSDGGQQDQSQQNKPTGQKAVAGAGADSKDFFHVKQSEGVWSSQKKIRLTKSKEDDDVLHEVDCTGEKDYCGGTPAKHKFAIVITTKGPAKNVYGRLPD